MLDITVKVQAPELANALLALAAAINATSLITPIRAGAVSIASPAPVAMPAMPPPASVATASAPLQVQAPAAPPVVPTAAAPTYDLDQIMTAGAALIDAGKIAELMGLLGVFGVQAVTQLGPEQLGAFATELRKLGAQI